MDLAPSLPSSPPMIDIEGPSDTTADSRRQLIDNLFIDVGTFTPRSRTGNLLVVLIAAIQTLDTIPPEQFDILRQEIISGRITEISHTGRTRPKSRILTSAITELVKQFPDADPEHSDSAAILVEINLRTRSVEQQVNGGFNAAVERELNRCLPSGTSQEVREEARDFAIAHLVFLGSLNESIVREKRDPVKKILTVILGIARSAVTNTDTLKAWQGHVETTLDGGFTTIEQADLDREFTRRQIESRTRRNESRPFVEEYLAFRRFLAAVIASESREIVKAILTHIRSLAHSFVLSPDALGYWQQRAYKALAGGYGTLGEFALSISETFRSMNDELRTAAMNSQPRDPTTMFAGAWRPKS